MSRLRERGTKPGGEDAGVHLSLRIVIRSLRALPLKGRREAVQEKHMSGGHQTWMLPQVLENPREEEAQEGIGRWVAP
jgi:hypothetical protein